jgi:hypothetical protein
MQMLTTINRMSGRQQYTIFERTVRSSIGADTFSGKPRRVWAPDCVTVDQLISSSVHQFITVHQFISSSVHQFIPECTTGTVLPV